MAAVDALSGAGGVGNPQGTRPGETAAHGLPPDQSKLVTHRDRPASDLIGRRVPRSIVRGLLASPGLPQESRPALLSKPLVRRLASVVDRVMRARLGAVGQRPQEIGQLGVPISLIKARALAYLSSASACSDFDGPDAPASRWPHRTPRQQSRNVPWKILSAPVLVPTCRDGHSF